MRNARRLPTDCPPDCLVFEGVRIPFFLEPGKGWRIRKRSVHLTVDFSTGIVARAPAIKRAREWLDDWRAGREVRRGAWRSVADLLEMYLRMPRRASDATAHYNVTQFKAIVRLVFGKEPDRVRDTDLGPEMWLRFQAGKLGVERVDFSKRAANHVSINTAVRSAASVVKKNLWPAYERAGFRLAPDLLSIEWLQELRKPKREVSEVELLKAWRALPHGALWMAVGLARFAGLRKEEVAACRGSWLEQQRGRWGVVVCDRPEEGFLCKTGEPRFSVLLNGEILDALRSMESAADLAVALPLGQSRERWFRQVPQDWLRLYLGDRDAVKKPMHRLRGLYLDEVRALAETRLQEAAIAEAQEAAGHTSAEVTKRHYLSAT